MKKFILITGLMLFTLLRATAQHEKEAIASTNYMLQKGNTAIKDNLSFNYSNNPSYHGPAKDYDYYMKKKKNNLTAGLVTLGAGLVLSGIGLISATSSNSLDNDVTAGVLLVSGAASGIASIPLMIMSTVYGHKAKLELSNQKTGFGLPPNVSKDLVGLTVKISIGN